MPTGKLTAKELGEAGERLTQSYFNLEATSGSGVGRFDKLDSKNDWLRVETKATGRGFYDLDTHKFKKWRMQAAKSRRQFFLHLVTDSLQPEDTLVVISESYFSALNGTKYPIAWSHTFVEKSHRIKFEDWAPIQDPALEQTLEKVDRLTCTNGENLVILRAPFFKDLLDE